MWGVCVYRCERPRARVEFALEKSGVSARAREGWASFLRTGRFDARGVTSRAAAGDEWLPTGKASSFVSSRS